MKKKLSLLIRLLVASASASPLWLAAAALAEPRFTYSRTEQSAVVQATVSALLMGNTDGFLAQLDGEARDRYGSRERMKILADNLTTRIETDRSQTINYRTHLASQMQADSHFGLIANRDYRVDVLGDTRVGAKPMLKMRVRCIGISFLDNVGGTKKACKVLQISTDFPETEAIGSARAPAGYFSVGRVKNLREDSSAPATEKPGAERAGIR